MTTPNSWQLIVDRQNPAIAQLIEPDPEPPLTEGRLRLRIERLALTANVLTYARSGDALGFWQLFPAPSSAPAGWGRVPAWGHAVVEQSAHSEVSVGERFFGLLPMASHWTLPATRSLLGLRDDWAHRATINPVYNQYALSETSEPEALDQEALFRPLLITSFVLEQHLREQHCFGAADLWISSASSKTALGLADRMQGLLPLRGFSSSSNLGFVQQAGCHDSLHDYLRLDEAARSGGSKPVLLVDFSGDDGLVQRMVQVLGSRLVRVLRVGSTHWQRAGALGLPQQGDGAAAQQDFFFGLEHIVRLVGLWGPREFEQRLREALARFARRSAGWYRHEQHFGAQGLLQAYKQLAAGQLPPDSLCIARPA